MDEDANKKIIRINRATHRVTAALALRSPKHFCEVGKNKGQNPQGTFFDTYVHDVKYDTFKYQPKILKIH